MSPHDQQVHRLCSRLLERVSRRVQVRPRGVGVVDEEDAPAPHQSALTFVSGSACGVPAYHCVIGPARLENTFHVRGNEAGHSKRRLQGALTGYPRRHRRHRVDALWSDASDVQLDEAADQQGESSLLAKRLRARPRLVLPQSRVETGALRRDRYRRHGAEGAPKAPLHPAAAVARFGTGSLERAAADPADLGAGGHDGETRCLEPCEPSPCGAAAACGLSSRERTHGRSRHGSGRHLHLAQSPKGL